MRQSSIASCKEEVSLRSHYLGHHLKHRFNGKKRAIFRSNGAKLSLSILIKINLSCEAISNWLCCEFVRSRHSKCALVRRGRWLQRHGDRLAWSVARGPFQLLQAQVLSQDGAHARRPNGKSTDTQTHFESATTRKEWGISEWTHSLTHTVFDDVWAINSTSDSLFKLLSQSIIEEK